MFEFQLQQKAIINNTDDEKLIITGVASDTTKDRYNEYVTPETLKSLCEQAKQLNLHYNHKMESVLGKITDATIKNNQLHIQAEILPEYAKGLRDKLEFGINYGLSISGLAYKNKAGALTSYDLVEISLTEEPANANTYATVQIDNQKTLKSDCLNGLCYIIDKEVKNMSENNTDTDYITVDDLNNALNEYKEELLNTLRDEFKEDIINDEDFKNNLVEVVLSKLDEEESESQEEVDEKSKDEEEEKESKKFVKLLNKALDKRFTEFEEKHFKKLDETRNPKLHMTNTKNMNKKTAESNKKTIREISELYGGL